MPRILISGSLAYDRIMDFPGRFRDHLLPEKLHALSVCFAIEDLTESFGGTAGNIAYSLALLGEKPSILSAAGRDFGSYDAWLAKHGIDTSRVVRGEKPTAAAYVMTDRDDNQITAFYFGAGEAPCDAEIPENTMLAIAAAGNIADMLSVPEQCRARGLPFFVDPGQQVTALSSEQVRAYVQGAAVLFGNDYEMELVRKNSGLDTAGLLDVVGAIVMTKGREGSVIITTEGEEHVPAVRTEATDPTGAGDAYRAGFAASFLAQRPLCECARLGSTVAAYAVEHSGTQNHSFTREALVARYHEAYGEPLPVPEAEK